jgi:hypothetical protein
MVFLGMKYSVNNHQKFIWDMEIPRSEEALGKGRENI